MGGGKGKAQPARENIEDRRGGWGAGTCNEMRRDVCRWGGGNDGREVL